MYENKQKLNLFIIPVIVFILAGCVPPPVKTKNNLVTNEISIRTGNYQTNKILEDNKDIYFIVKGDHSNDSTGILYGNDSGGFGDIGKKFYDPQGIIKNKSKGKTPLRYKKTKNHKLMFISNMHKTLLFIDASCYPSKITYSKNKGLFSYDDLCNKYPRFDYEIKYKNYHLLIPKINHAIETKEYEKIYTIKDKDIKYFIKDYLLNHLSKINNINELNKYSKILKNFNINNYQDLILVQQAKINISKDGKSNYKNILFMVKVKKLPIRDLPNIKNSEILGYYKKDDIIVAKRNEKGWILTNKGWVRLSKLRKK